MSANPKRIQKRAGANGIDLFFGWAVLVCLFISQAARAEELSVSTIGLRNGETLTYSVRWGFIPSVGRIKISAETSGTGADATLKVTTTTSTWGLARGLFAFDGRGESTYQAQSGLLLSSTEWSSYQDKVVKDSLTFNYRKMTATFTDEIHPEKSRSIPMPQGNPSDLILALIQTRYWTLAPGQARDTLVIFKDQFYPLTIRAQDDFDYIFTSLGIFKTTVLVPRMEKTPPIGMFKRGSTVRVWIQANDERRLPVRFEVGFKFGTGTATLIDYQPPK
jgi:Protein of unknown function (DUF3108)